MGGEPVVEPFERGRLWSWSGDVALSVVSEIVVRLSRRSMDVVGVTAESTKPL